MDKGEIKLFIKYLKKKKTQKFKKFMKHKYILLNSILNYESYKFTIFFISIYSIKIIFNNEFLNK